MSVVRDDGLFLGGVTEKLLVKLTQDRNVTAKFRTADFTMVKNEIKVVFLSLK
jgi:hypothetical protein